MSKIKPSGKSNTEKQLNTSNSTTSINEPLRDHEPACLQAQDSALFVFNPVFFLDAMNAYRQTANLHHPFDQSVASRLLSSDKKESTELYETLIQLQKGGSIEIWGSPHNVIETAIWSDFEGRQALCLAMENSTRG